MAILRKKPTKSKKGALKKNTSKKSKKKPAGKKTIQPKKKKSAPKKPAPVVKSSNPRKETQKEKTPVKAPVHPPEKNGKPQFLRKSQSQSKPAPKVKELREEPKTAAQIIIEKRHEIRRVAEAMTYALLFVPKHLIETGDKHLPAEISAILVDESDHGCSLVFNKDNPMTKYLAQGLRYVIELKGQRPRVAEARWKTSMNGTLINMGFRLF